MGGHGRSGWSIRGRWLAAAIAVALLTAAGIVAVLWPAGQPNGGYAGPLPSQSRPGPVLLVPGYGGKRPALLQLAGEITDATGRDTDVLRLIGDGTGDLVAESDLLYREIVTRVHAGAPSVDLIGYSAGGVVVRLLFDRTDAARYVRRVVTLGSPFHGTTLASVAALFVNPDCPVACKQLATVSTLIKHLGDTPLPRGLPWLSIWSTGDTMVTPPDSARLAGAVNVPVQRTCPREKISHSGLPTDAVVGRLVLDALGTGSIPAPTASVCTAPPVNAAGPPR